MEIAFTILGGLFLLAVGGEFLVRGAVQLATRMGVSPLLIGLTLVGFGTSMPELVTSVKAALIDSPGIAVGNVVGSCIANILLILGLAALLSPIKVGQMALRRDGALVLVTAIAFATAGWTVGLDHKIGLVFLGALVSYIIYAWRQERVSTQGHTAAFEKAEAFDALHPSIQSSGAAAPTAGVPGVVLSTAFALGGLCIVILGGSLLVDGSVTLARNLGISETVIGLTIVAIGTSMPEFVTSIVAAIRRQSDVALGNILGSNIYNILGIGGVVALIAPTAMPAEIVNFDNLVLVGISALLLIFAWTGYRIGRREGAVLLSAYGLYVWAIWPA